MNASRQKLLGINKWFFGLNFHQYCSVLMAEDLSLGSRNSDIVLRLRNGPSGYRKRRARGAKSYRIILDCRFLDRRKGRKGESSVSPWRGSL